MCGLPVDHPSTAGGRLRSDAPRQPIEEPLHPAPFRSRVRRAAGRARLPLHLDRLDFRVAGDRELDLYACELIDDSVLSSRRCIALLTFSPPRANQRAPAARW
jgi:hypothetical protein